MYQITAFDTSGALVLKREALPSALKKARELLHDDCWDVEIVAPDGRVYAPKDFEEA